MTDTRRTAASGAPPPAVAARRWRPARGPAPGLPGALRRRTAWAAGLLAAVLLCGSLAVQPFVVVSGSMENTLRTGDRVLVNKLAYRFGDVPARGDVVVFDGTGTFTAEGPRPGALTRMLRTTAAAAGLAEPPGNDYVKRVIGTGGDRVTCCDPRGRIEVNGEPLTERYLRPGDQASSVPFDVVVPDGRLWVMGDHRSGSSDSRDHLGRPGGGTVPVERVIGRVDAVGWPPTRWTAVHGGHG
ncbi:signal peptidase I [Streptomyces sp. TRM 70351]|uniref:signal peptidase I n=1 Tax=Streptomyces sp. TRM 70351 TaxID=3116552 RepID=UPI002E7B944C|nr:signal peptidase I [Streptomyces sp. TRM 70351]MEE1931138.1 signal peptidase I [Streptomyces sp. TRM 70351]